LERLGLGAEVGVAGARLAEQDLTVGGGAAQGRGEDGAHLMPALGGHEISPWNRIAIPNRRTGAISIPGHLQKSPSRDRDVVFAHC
jgi:hypothetical protein